MKQLTVDNLSMSYEGRRVLEKVSFTLGSGDFLFILGENGTGKTTLIKGLLGLKSIDDGSISFDGIKREDIGYLSQSTPHQKNFPATVEEILLSGLLSKKSFFSRYTKEDKQKTYELMKKLGIEELRDAAFSSLSGGQQQRVLLCRALNSATKILVLDEPTTFLDAKASAEMYETLKTLNDEGLTVVMVSHDFSAASKYASHVLYVKSKPLFFGRSQSFFQEGGIEKFGGVACE